MTDSDVLILAIGIVCIILWLFAWFIPVNKSHKCPNCKRKECTTSYSYTCHFYKVFNGHNYSYASTYAESHAGKHTNT